MLDGELSESLDIEQGRPPGCRLSLLPSFNTNMLEVVEAVGEGLEVGGRKVSDPLFAHAFMGMSENRGCRRRVTQL